MTLQNDLARPWFEPLVPSDPPAPETAIIPAADGPPVADDSLTTRIEGELPLDEALTPRRTAGESPAGSAAPTTTVDPVSPAERIEVTQPYIPAIRDEQPEFAKRLNPEPTTQVPPPPPAVPAAPPTPASTPAPPPAEYDRAGTPTQESPAARPPAHKSLFRRVVRRIIGPDLLRKDPPKSKKR